MKIVFATYAGHPGISIDDALAANELQRLGYEVEAQRWDDTEVDWSSYAAVIPRMTWDYHERVGEFETWLEKLDMSGARVLNSLALLRWNIRKTYLAELANHGVPVVPTQWHESGYGAAETIIQEITGLPPASEWILKPIISAGAYQTLKIRAADVRLYQSEIENLVALGTVMQQPFLNEIAERGEWSLYYFDGKLAHAVHKKPKSGDFRVQPEHGGSTEARTPTSELIRIAEATVHAAPSMPTYARVDLVELASGPHLMELELIEPNLFLRIAPESAAKEFALAVVRGIT